MIKKYLLIFIFGLLFLGQQVSAQDPQFSQFYAAPLYLNPAFAGASGGIMGGINYRNQWPSIPASYVTISAWGEYYFDDYNSGVGLLITADREGLAGLRSTSIGLQYSYQLELTDKLTFRPGFQAAFVTRDLNFSKLTFGDQFDSDGNVIPDQATSEQFNSDFKVNFLDLALGSVLYSKDFWVGAAFHHLNAPNQSLLDDGDRSPLPMKMSIHGGYRLMLPIVAYSKGFNPQRKERSVTPTFQYKAQGDFDQFDAGAYFTFEPIVFGLLYRGLPIKSYESFPNNESLIVLFGITHNNLNIGYSFDYTISGLGITSGGAHEISISYAMENKNSRKPPKSVRKIPCPRF